MPERRLLQTQPAVNIVHYDKSTQDYVLISRNYMKSTECYSTIWHYGGAILHYAAAV